MHLIILLSAYVHNRCFGVLCCWYISRPKYSFSQLQECLLLATCNWVPVWELLSAAGNCFALFPRESHTQSLFDVRVQRPGPLPSIGSNSVGHPHLKTPWGDRLIVGAVLYFTFTSFPLLLHSYRHRTL